MSAYCGLPVRCELTLPGRSLDLMDVAQGFRIAQLDLGYPTVREDMQDAPVHAGVLDYTQFFGARAVTISGSIIASASGSRTASLQLLAPYMDPAARPVLIYQTDTDSDARQLTLRAADLTAPLDGLHVTTWAASFKAPAGVALGLDEDTAICGPSFLVRAGRSYNLTFNRVYPASPGSNQVTVVPDGDYPTPPVFTLYGPASGAQITVTNPDDASLTIDLKDTFTVNAGHYVVIDCGTRTITDDTGANVYGLALDALTSWPVLVPGEVNTISFYASGTAGATLLYTRWFPRWLI